jgi:hypothetical protein
VGWRVAAGVAWSGQRLVKGFGVAWALGVLEGASLL